MRLLLPSAYVLPPSRGSRLSLMGAVFPIELSLLLCLMSPYNSKVTLTLHYPISHRYSEIEKHPEVWDRLSEQYKGSKRDAWPQMVTALYPERPNLPKPGQKMIMDDVRKRWRSVTDIKSLKTPSGSSPPRKRVPFADQRQFILSSRSLRRTESNVYSQTPPDHEGDTSEHNIGEEVEDCRMVSQDSPGNMSSAGTSEDLTDTFGVMAIPANTAKCRSPTMLLPRTLHPALVVVCLGTWAEAAPIPWH
ncbi:unnamed protein product [Ranitomeya imitator]|uniref:MADF domain-containing protein n=1 Tax=Ranitomeya imitator TaxID=111125 RepID=A0ABN9LCD9_9NEOB|nr:unnamed protein product [Ranitomeya imitator]